MSQNSALVDKLLTNASQKYIPDGFICDIALTPLKSKQSSGKIGKYGTAHLRVVPSLMAGKASAKRIEIRQYLSDSFFIEPYGLEDFITPEEYDNVEEPFEIESDVTTDLTTLLYLSKEQALVIALTTAANYAAANKITLSGTSQWNDYVNSDPIANINTAAAAIRAAAGVVPDTLILDYNTARVLRFHPKILRNLGYADARAGQLSDQDLASALTVKRVLVANVVYDSSKEGQTATLAPIWGKFAVLAALPTSPSKLQKTMGYMVTRGGDSPRKVYKSSIDNPPDSKRIIVKDSYDIVITDFSCGYLFTNAIA